MRASIRPRIVLVVLCSMVVSCAGTQVPDMGSTLWGSLGGVSGVSKLASSFGKQLMNSASLSSILGDQGIEDVSRGLYNSIGDASGYKIDKGTDLQSALKKHDLSDDQIREVGDSIEAAGRDQGLQSNQMSMLRGLWEPIQKKLL